MVLGLEAGKVGPSSIEGLSRVYGVVVDWSVGDGFATFVALADGTASMYTSSGGGTIGAGGRQAIDEAGATLLRAAEANLDRMSPVPGSEPSVAGAVRYWALTRDGLRSTSHDASGPPDDAPDLEALGAAFQDYVTAFRLVDQERRASR